MGTGGSERSTWQGAEDKKSKRKFEGRHVTTLTGGDSGYLESNAALHKREVLRCKCHLKWHVTLDPQDGKSSKNNHIVVTCWTVRRKFQRAS